MCSYTLLLWIIKAAVCTFYLRLTVRLCMLPGQTQDSPLTMFLQAGLGYKKRVYTGFALIGVTWAAVLFTILFSCHPLSKNWQIYPNPGGTLQPLHSLRNTTLTNDSFVSAGHFASRHHRHPRPQRSNGYLSHLHTRPVALEVLITALEEGRLDHLVLWRALCHCCRNLAQRYHSFGQYLDNIMSRNVLTDAAPFSRTPSAVLKRQGRGRYERRSSPWSPPTCPSSRP